MDKMAAIKRQWKNQNNTGTQTRHSHVKGS